MIEIEFDPVKREKTLVERGLDFAWTIEVFEGLTLDREDNRADYGERRVITFGFLVDSSVVVVVWTPRGGKRRIISMRKANEREREEFAKYLG